MPNATNKKPQRHSDCAPAAQLLSVLTMAVTIDNFSIGIEKMGIFMGAIIFWAIVRMLVVIPLVWIMQAYLPGQYWWAVGFLAIYGIVIQPALVQYRNFEEENKEVIRHTLCSSCRNFDTTAVLCLKYDQHPTREKLPCEGLDWEPMRNESHEEEEKHI